MQTDWSFAVFRCTSGWTVTIFIARFNPFSHSIWTLNFSPDFFCCTTNTSFLPWRCAQIVHRLISEVRHKTKVYDNSLPEWRSDSICSFAVLQFTFLSFLHFLLTSNGNSHSFLFHHVFVKKYFLPHVQNSLKLKIFFANLWNLCSVIVRMLLYIFHLLIL